MSMIDDLIQTLRTNKTKPSDAEYRQLPYREAFIYPRLSSPAQVKDSRESIREIIEIFRLAKQDGYKSELTDKVVEELLLQIQTDITSKDVLADGQITIDFRDLGVSGRRPSGNRPGLRHLMDSIKEKRTGTVYVADASRLTREQSRITPYTLLDLFKQHSCRIRTPEYVKNPCIPGDWEDLRDELEDGIEETKVMARRLNRRRLQKAKRGEYVGGLVIPGFIVEIKETETSGRNIFGKYRRYPPHAEIDEIILREFIKQRYSEIRTYRALDGLMYPLFPPELKYMEALSSLRKAKKIEGRGYLISPSMMSSLAKTPALIGVWTWGDIEPIPDNHEKAVPSELWFEAFRGQKESIKPRGRGINSEPLEWNGLLLCCNHEVPQRIYGHSSKEFYHHDFDDVHMRGKSCVSIAADYLDRPLTEAVLRQITFTPLAEEVLMQMEADYSHLNLEAEERKKNIAEYKRRLDNLKGMLGWNEGKHQRVLLDQIDQTQNILDELESRPAPVPSVPVASYPVIKDFLSGLPGKWNTYPRTLRNRLLTLLVKHVDVLHKGQIIEATIHFKTGQKEEIKINRARIMGYRESLWSKEEKRLLKMLWPNTTRETVMAAILGRTWSAIRHQAQTVGLKRIPAISNCVPRLRWSPDDDYKAKCNYEIGTPVDDIAADLQRSCSAIMQRASEKGWKRPANKAGGGANSLPSVKQRPMVSNGACSGSVLGDRSLKD